MLFNYQKRISVSVAIRLPAGRRLKFNGQDWGVKTTVLSVAQLNAESVRAACQFGGPKSKATAIKCLS